MSAHLIAPCPAGGGKLQNPRQTAIIGEDQKPLSVDIQPTDRDHPRHILWQAVKHGGPAFRIRMAGHKAARLVIEPGAGGLCILERHPVDHDHVLVENIVGGRGEGLTIDDHAASLNPAFCLAARAKANAGHAFCDAFALFRGISALGSDVFFRFF